MILQYVDDSGDVGLVAKSPTRFYVLSTMIIYEDDWNETFRQIKQFRIELQKKYKIKMSDEMKANHLIRKQGFAYRLNLNETTRIIIYRSALKLLSTLSKIKLFSVCIRKKQIEKKTFNVFDFAWRLLMTRLHYTSNRLNKAKHRLDKSILISDETDEAKVRKMLRALRVINFIQGKNYPLDTFIEDPFIRKSDHSHFVQLCDLVAFSVAAKNLSSKLTDPYNFPEMYKLLDPILEKSVFASPNSEGIVYFPK